MPNPKNNELNDVEKNIKIEEINLITPTNVITELLWAKICLSAIITIILSPIAICDIYYALNDTSCVTENVQFMVINMKMYLFVSSLIAFATLGVIVCMIFLFDYTYNIRTSITRNDDDAEIYTCSNLCQQIFKWFNLSWLIVGCVLFWGYMDVSLCEYSIRNYLYSRFIIGIVFYSLGQFSKI